MLLLTPLHFQNVSQTIQRPSRSLAILSKQNRSHPDIVLNKTIIVRLKEEV